jgi:hypothetical protein
VRTARTDADRGVVADTRVQLSNAQTAVVELKKRISAAVDEGKANKLQLSGARRDVAASAASVAATKAELAQVSHEHLQARRKKQVAVLALSRVELLVKAAKDLESRTREAEVAVRAEFDRERMRMKDLREHEQQAWVKTERERLTAVAKKATAEEKANAKANVDKAKVSSQF